MISVILIWAYMLFISYILGIGLCKVLKEKGLEYQIHNQISFVLVGVGFLIFYSQLFSLFYKVGLVANLVLLVISGLTVFGCKEELKISLENLKSKTSLSRMIIFIVLFLGFAYMTSHGIMHYDSDLYHAQSIRWIEEYGVIKGLGNLHTRLAYNSASFCLSALFSFSFLGIQSFHACAGFLAFVVAILSFRLFENGIKVKATLSNVIRIVAIYYLLIIFDEMVSPASDYFMVLLTLSVMILFSECIERKEKNFYPYVLLSFMTLIILSVKISGALIVLLTIYPAYLLIKDNKMGLIIRYLVTGVVLVLPFFIRNIILSGYLIYPVTGIDIFNLAYKIPKGIAEYDSREIQVYGRGYSDVSRFDEPIIAWIRGWFGSLDAINKVMFLLGIVGLVFLLVILVTIIVKKDYEKFPQFLVLATSNICFIFWLLTSPNIRYGCVFLWLAPATVFGGIYIDYISLKDRGILFRSFVALFVIYKGITFSQEVISGSSSLYLLRQQDYGKYEMTFFEVGDIKVYIPLEGDQTGYAYFPSAPYEVDVELIGNDIKNGFRNGAN